MLVEEPGHHAIELGTVVLPSGMLVVGGLAQLALWSGESEPQPPELFDDPDLVAELATARDLRVVGPDAEAAARALARESQTYLYDIPYPEEVERRFRALVTDRGLDAALAAEGRRVPHAQRARRAAQGRGSDFLVWGLWMTAVGGLPAWKPLRVIGRRVERGDGLGASWESVQVEASRRAAARTEMVGYVSVDGARVIFADVLSLNAWAGADPLESCARLGGNAVDNGAVAELELTGVRAFATMTPRRDGVFAVETDRAADDAVVAVRVVFGYSGADSHDGSAGDG